MALSRDSGLVEAIAVAGSVSHLARVAGVRQSTAASWQTIPVKHVLVIADALQIPRSRLRPDVYPPDREGV